MRAALLSPLIPFLQNEALDVTMTPTPPEQISRNGGPPLMPYVLRGHRLIQENNEDDSDEKTGGGSSWWVRVDDNDFNGPSSRRSLDSSVYQVLKKQPNSDNDERRAWWLTDMFDDEEGDASSSSSSPSTNTTTGNNSFVPLNTTDSSTEAEEENSDEELSSPPRPGNPIPLPSNIDTSQFSPSYMPPIGNIEREFMVVSGGFTDTDWLSFPVWAFELNSTFGKGTNWRDLSGLNVGHAGPEKPNEGDNENGDNSSKTLWPPGRVGHVSSLHNGDLHIFGGMLWKDKNFVVEEAPYIWKARVEHKLNPPEESLHNNSVLEWERIIPTIRFYKDLHIDDVEDGSSSNTTIPENPPENKNNNNNNGQVMELTRGECRGGHWESGSGLVFYGGLHVKHQLNGHHKDTQDDVVLGDVWMYNYTTQTMEQLSPYPPPESQRGKWGRYPVARTAHAATVVGNSLFVYGGMTSSAWSATRDYNGVGAWEELSDLWEFDLVERKWKERFMATELSRSYHSMVGWGDGSLAIFGGFRTARTISGEPIAFVFSDTLVSHPDDPTWWKAEWPQEQPGNGYEVSASNRLEHTAAVDKFGSMYVWGGRFKTVSQIHGMWSLDVFNADSNVEFEIAPPDGLEAYEAELEALHMLVAVMLLMSVLFTALYGTLRRQAMEQEGGGGNGNAMGILGRRRGLSREAIDAIPIKRFGEDGESPAVPETSPENESSNTGGLSDVALEDVEECCPICLLEYEQGEELRLLPCNHEFHKECIDSWLENNTSCPACRHSLSNTSGEELLDGDGLWRDSNTSGVTMVPVVSLTQLLAGREISMFDYLEDDAAPPDFRAPASSETNVSRGEDSNADDAEDEGNIGTGSRRRLFGFTRYFSLPQARSSEPSGETLGDTEMTTIGESSTSRPSLQMI